MAGGIPFANQNTQAAPGTIGLPDDYLRVQADPAAFGFGGWIRGLMYGPEPKGGR